MWWLIGIVARAVPPEVAGQTDDEVSEPGVTLPPGPAPVVGGAPASPGRWPDAAALYTLDGAFGCTGTLIAPDLVLTAGHCGFGMSYVVVGTDDQRDPDTGETVAIVESIPYPSHTTTFDVAVLVLETEVNSVTPRTLALDCVAVDHVLDGGEVAIVGYGATDEWATEWTQLLMEAWTTIRDADCSDLAAGCNSAVSPGGELVAGGDGIDSCQGDSGGPLYVQTPVGDFLAGSTSRAALPLTTPCGGGGIYVRADAIAPWIEEVTGRILPRPECEGWNYAPHPAAPDLDAIRGSIAAVRVDPHDPNPDDAHTFRIVEGPSQGGAIVDAAGWVQYVLPLDAVAGSDSVVVEVTDDGEPPQAGAVTIDIAIPEKSGVAPTGGCATTPTGGLALALAVFAARRRRR